MILGGRKASLLLLMGDLAAFSVALYLTLWIRYGAPPSAHGLVPYLVPFGILFALWVLVFFVAGLYSKRFIFSKSRLVDVLLKTQTTNILLAALFFFLIPGIGIAPKTILLLYLPVSLALVFLFRLGIFPSLAGRRARMRALLLASGSESEALAREVNENPRYGIVFCEMLSPDSATDPELLEKKLRESKAGMIVADLREGIVPAVLVRVYQLSREKRNCAFIEFADLYEEVFDRVPLSRLSYDWFLTDIAPADSFWYAFMRRAIDILGGLAMLLVTIIALPFVWLLLRLEGKGSIFVKQERLGARGAHIEAYKFRSMRFSDSGMWPGEGENTVTRVGAFLRKTSLDEFPQCLNILRGELSLIGPRNDISALGARLAEALPYYEARYLITPGITGWAQINQQYEQNKISPQSVEETKTRLAYDFYYLKHRSLGLDLVIALKTVKRMLFRVSSW